ncbi:MAG TPA: tRNA lysidine(34) synthetase TilS, partial [Chitinophagaceae bacterium]|nr:tRNA lysidine(34) synthetase TilS [Chitinophagaceae bacterium]
MQLLSSFQQFIAAENLFSRHDRLLLAVSGGVDSVVLCALCHEAGYNFSILHCNFMLRGAESDEDEIFVQAMAARYGVDFHTKKFDTAAYAKEHKLSIQVAARQLRYAWFEAFMQEQHALEPAGNPPRHLLTAHHLDDNIETMLMNFFKGTGIAGLRGIQPKHGKIVRPLLFAHKERLLQFAQEQQLAWREDSSNQSDKYTRNYLRHQLLPLLKNIYPQVEENLAHNLSRFKETEILYQQAVQLHLKKLLLKRGAEWHIPALKLKNSVPLASIVYEIGRHFGVTPDQTGDIIALLDAPTGRYVPSATHRIIKNRQWLIVSPLQTEEAGVIVIDSPKGSIEYAQGTLTLQLLAERPAVIPADPFVAALDASEIAFPLLLRRWKAGDYFYPLGMKKKKKLSRFFIDAKL